MKLAVSKKATVSSMHLRGIVNGFLEPLVWLEPAWSQRLCQLTVALQLFIKQVQDHNGL